MATFRKFGSKKAVKASFENEMLLVELESGETVSLPLVWFPKLYNATDAEREKFRIMSDGSAICWDDLDEEIALESYLA